MKQISLNVLDQSPRRAGQTFIESLSETVRLATIVERLGFKRFWVAEHHNSRVFAGTSPELLIPQIAANTKRIRIGSGGVMLSNYSPLKVAELFSVLSAFYPERIDLGIGRASGCDEMAGKALRAGQRDEYVDFEERVLDTINLLNGGGSKKYPEVKSHHGPGLACFPEVWLLGSGNASARVAARLGLPFVFADFLGRARDKGPSVVQNYRDAFPISQSFKRPQASVAIEVVCAETQDEAELLALSGKFLSVEDLYNFDGIQPHEILADLHPDKETEEIIRQSTYGQIVGSPNHVKNTIWRLSEDYGVLDFFIVTNCHRFEHRVRSYQLLAAVLDLGREDTSAFFS